MCFISYILKSKVHETNLKLQPVLEYKNISNAIFERS
jgi:hypothetical protein